LARFIRPAARPAVVNLHSDRRLVRERTIWIEASKKGEQLMNWTSGNAGDALRNKINDASKRLKDLEASAKNEKEKAKSDAKAYLASLDDKIKAQRAQVKASEANAKAWVQNKADATNAKIAEWKAKRELKKIAGHADGAEDYAVATILLAAAAVDEAERATLEAIVARIDADMAQSADAKAA
jgi:hypothetical protein